MQFAILSAMERIVGISEASEVLGVSVPTLCRWEAAGKLAAEHTPAADRLTTLPSLRAELFRAAVSGKPNTVAFALVSSHDQKQDLERQTQVPERGSRQPRGTGHDEAGTERRR